MPPTEVSTEGMLCLSRHEACPWREALQAAELTWTGLQYTCLKILHLYCKVFEREDNSVVIRHLEKCAEQHRHPPSSKMCRTASSSTIFKNVQNSIVIRHLEKCAEQYRQPPS
ncbi:Protein espinas [Operophtera brumata]|uniref:Protein espinas n=1 Tax=Operophtera brumata TaxID=104452 RepID=A0A0L7L9Z2_OPEBR|nr:Protein espinas [Operophtera brumata]